MNVEGGREVGLETEEGVSTALMAVRNSERKTREYGEGVSRGERDEGHTVTRITESQGRRVGARNEE